MSDRVLPNDVKILIFIKLPLHEAALCRQVCKHWNTLISNSCSIWKSKNYEEFCDKVRNIPLKYHYIFKPRNLTRSQLLMFLDMCQYTYKKQITLKYKLAKKHDLNKIDLTQFRNGIMLYLVIQEKVTIKELSLISLLIHRRDIHFSIFSDLAVYYIIKNGVSNLVGKSAIEVSDIMRLWGMINLIPEEHLVKINALSFGMKSRFLHGYFSEYGKFLLEQKYLSLEDVIANPLRFVALTRNEFAILGFKEKLFEPQIIHTCNNTLCFALSSYLVQKGLREHLFTIDDLKQKFSDISVPIEDRLHDILKLLGKYREFIDCLRENLFTLDDCRRVSCPEYLRFLLCQNGMCALREGLVTLENVHLHFPYDDPSLIPRKMSDEQLENIRNLKKIKYY
jgi:hypothetical protein